MRQAQFDHVVGVTRRLVRPVAETRSEAVRHLGATHTPHHSAQRCLAQRLARLWAEKEQAVVAITLAVEPAQQLERFGPRRDDMLPGALHTLARDAPKLLVEVDLAPRCLARFGAACCSEDCEFQCPRG